MATVALWVRSYWIDDAWYVRYELHYIHLASYRGELGIEFGAVSGVGPRSLYNPSWVSRYRPVPVDRMPGSDYVHIVELGGKWKTTPPYHDVLGFRWHPRYSYTWEYKERGIAVPAWFVVMLTGFLPAVRALRSRRLGAGLCASCGYDLRATPGRCPECGEIPIKVKA
jgi:hypothetical protein